MPEAWVYAGVVAAAAAYGIWYRLLAYLRYFQQEGYEHARFLRWTKVRPLTDPMPWIAIGAALLVPRQPALSIILFVVAAVGLALVQPDPRRSGKIPLRMTARAQRIFFTSLAVAAAFWVLLSMPLPAPAPRAALVSSAIVLVALPLVLVAANLLLGPFEQRVQDRFEADARARLAAVRPFVIGITGSYGKSSSKAMLAHILQFHAPTLAAAGSINTPMGITRHIREQLVSGHQFMVSEMGAFRRGSIRRLCELTPPSAGLITAVGDMHLERFGSTEEIVRAKGELAEALPKGGLLVVNADSPGALRIAKASTHARVLLYGESSPEDLAVRVRGITFSPRGTDFELVTKHGTHQCHTPLLGRPIILNLTGAFTLASALGVPEALIVAAMRTLEPVSNRLEVAEDAGITWIRDAYNSNQFGFRAALEVAAALPANRRFLVTPGVIELGGEQAAVNQALSREAAMICDNTVIVSDTNREAFRRGHADAGREDRLVVVANRSEAFKWIRETTGPGDLVVLENDLPDLYERTEGLFWP